LSPMCPKPPLPVESLTSEIFYPPEKNIAVMADGAVVPLGPRSLSPSEIVSQLKDLVSLPYHGGEADKIGMTLIEAALYSAAKKAADGNLDALEKILNRLMGKPMQTVVSASGTLKEFLDGIARSDPGSDNNTDPFDE
jgi:hypothetical protein